MSHPQVGLEPFATLADGLDHPEGVAWDPGGVVWTGGEAGQLYAIELDNGATRQVAELGGQVLGVTLDGDGRVYACAGDRVMRFDPADDSVETFFAGTEGDPLRQPNFAAFAHDGAFYLTDSGSWDGEDGVLYRIAPDGAAEVWTREPAGFPNGCCLTPEGDALLVVLSQGLRTGVVRVPIQADGSAGAMEQVCLLPGSVPDGIALDDEGRLYVACYRPDAVHRVGVDGDVELLAHDPYGTAISAPTNVAFVGPELSRLAVANIGAGHVSVADVGARGLPLVRPTLNRLS